MLHPSCRLPIVFSVNLPLASFVFGLEESTMGDAVYLFSMLGFMMAVVYLVLGVVRRKQQLAMQKHLLDKFSSTNDFTEFVQSPAGQKYVASFSETVTKPRSSILISVRVGIVLIFVGVACFLVRTYEGDARYLFNGLGTVLSMLGLGFLVSGLASYVIAKKIRSEQAN
jgi:drug/metabolite transporter (DMT)-like permease